MVTPPVATILDGQTMALGTTVLDPGGSPITGRAVTWESSDTTIAKVTAPGVVTGKAVGGPATISAMCEGQRGTATITVIPVPVAAVVVGPDTSVIVLGQTLQVTATPADSTGSPLAGRTITWASSDSAIATVTSTGL